MPDKSFLKMNKKKFSREVAALRRTIEEFWQIIPIPLFSTDKKLNILKVGKTFKSFFNYQEKEIIGQNLNKIFFKEKEFKKLKAKLFQEGSLEGEEVVLISQNNKKIFTAVYAKPKKNNSDYIFSFLDISKRKKVEKELQEKVKDLQRFTKELKESRLALLNILEDMKEARNTAEIEKDKTLAIIENFPEGLLFFNQENKLVSINPKAQLFFSTLANEVINRNFEELKQKESFKPLFEVLEKDKEENIKNVLKKEIVLDENLTLEISAISINSRNKRIGTLVNLRDISREKVIERLKTEFVSIAAHQLRTPLSGIKWTLRMLLDEDLGKLNKEQKDFLEKTYNGNERMIRLINDLLNVTRIEEGRFLYKKKEANIVEIAKKVIQPLEEIAKRKKIELTLKADSDIPPFKVDAEKISLVFQNLTDNAVHYTEKGGKVVVSIKYLEKEKEILVSIQDNGIGIPKEQQERVFSRFFRGDNAVKTETEGTGLGLYIAKNIVEAHKGEIWFKSTPGRGTTFYFTIPS